MLDRKTIENPKAVEEIFCIPFGKLPQTPLDERMSEIMMKLNFHSMGHGGNPPDFPKEDKHPLMFMLEESLATRFSFKIPDPTLRFFICAQAGTIGIIIMYLTYLQYECKRRDIKELNWEKFSGLFAGGFPTEPDLQTIWELQKVKRGELGEGSDNLLDYQSAMVSIQYLQHAE